MLAASLRLPYLPGPGPVFVWCMCFLLAARRLLVWLAGALQKRARYFFAVLPSLGNGRWGFLL